MKNLTELRFFIGFSLLCFSYVTTAQVSPSTGSRISGTNVPRTVIQFEEPQEIKSIRKLIKESELGQALTLAESYIEYLEYSVSNVTSRYNAYHALCIIHANLSHYSQAIDNCTTAISLQPKKWIAYNTRGAAKMLFKDYQGAQLDFEKALENADSRELALNHINHNINLTKARM